MRLNLCTTGTCRHCGWTILRATQPDGTTYWVHSGTWHHRCTTTGTDTTSAEPVKLEIVR
ncbi:hypothetical protein [Crossiella sp. CA198]|uniref:hypothetical protein n=1 Tax=Crossiella sp. CA198 TaxID=3455607 RepID=UPI003F8D1B16